MDNLPSNVKFYSLKNYQAHVRKLNSIITYLLSINYILILAIIKLKRELNKNHKYEQSLKIYRD